MFSIPDTEKEICNQMSMFLKAKNIIFSLLLQYFTDLIQIQNIKLYDSYFIYLVPMNYVVTTAYTPCNLESEMIKWYVAFCSNANINNSCA